MGNGHYVACHRAEESSKLMGSGSVLTGKKITPPPSPNGSNLH